MDKTDWRLETAGHESFQGKVFVLRKFAPSAAIMWDLSTGVGTTSEWDHEHCRFCWRKFAAPELGIEDALEEGYVTSFDDPSPDTEARLAGPPTTKPANFRIQEPLDSDVWVCPRCFADFREHYGWTLAEEAGG